MIVRIPDDMYSYENKSCGNFTTRQVVCIALSFIVIAPVFIGLFILTNSVELSAGIAVFLGLPIILCGIVKKHGLYAEQVLKYKLQWKFKWPQKRPYRMNNLYETIEREYQKYEASVADAQREQQDKAKEE